MVSTDQVATVTVLSSEPTVTYYANFASGSNFTITEDASISEHGTVTYKVNGTETAPVSGVINAKENDVITLIVTPNTGWVVDKVEGKWTAAVAKAPRRRATIGLLQDIDLGDGSTDQTTGAVTYSFTMERANAVISAAYKKLLTHADISISNILPVIYNGQPFTPNFTVKDGSKTLVKGTDYTVTYTNNVNAGDKDAAEGAPTVTIKAVEGHEFYVGEKSRTFTIRKKTLEDGFMSTVQDVTYSGKLQEPTPVLTYDGMTLELGTDYVFSYINNKDVAQATDVKAPMVTASATKNSNFSGAATQKFNIKKAPLTVKAADVNVIYGKDAPQYTVSYEGFVAEETEAVLEGTLAIACDYTTESAVGSTFAITPSGLTAKNYDITFVPGTLTVFADLVAIEKENLQTTIAIATNVSPEGLADAIAAARAALTDKDATAESVAQATQTLEAAIKAYFAEVLPRLGAIVQGLNDETLNAAYADAQTTLAKEGVTLQELIAATQNIITAAKAVAPEHLQNLKAYAVKYGAEDAAILVDNALAAIEAGNVSQIIATMTAVKEAATPLAQQVLSGIIGYVQAFGLTEQATQAQAALESGNYITMITTAKALFTHLVAAAKEYLPKLGAIVEGLNDETLNAAYADAQTLLAKESITPEELGAAMQNIIAAAKAVAPEHLQNLRGYAVKYGAADAVDKVDAALAAIEAGNVSQIIATMTAVKEAATPLAQQVLSGIIGYVQAFGLTEQATQAQAALESGNYITMITTAKALFTHLIAAAKEYLPKLGAIVEGLNDETLNAAYADAQTLLAKESITPEELGAAMQNIITAAKAVAPEHLQNLRGYAVKYGAADAVDKVDAALAAIEAGNVSQIIATMTAVKEAATPLAQQVLSGIIGYVQAFGLTEQATQAQAALESGNYITMITTAKALFTHLIAAAKEYLPKLGAIVEGLNDETLNAAYADAQTLLAKESITPEELGAAMQNIIAAAKAVAPEHLQNLRGYAVKYGAADAVDKVDAALAAIEAGNVSQIIATMTAVKEAATPLAQQVLSGIIGYVQAFGLTEQATQAQAALESGNYITMITTAKALFTHLIAAAKEYLPKLGAIVEGLNDETLNAAYADAQTLLAKESITPEELGAAMQNIIAAAKAVAPEHLQNLRGYAVKYGAADAVDKVDAALAAINAGNVSQIIATMTAVKEAATPLATAILTQIIGYAQNYAGFADDVTAAQAALNGGNYITMITTAKALYAKLMGAANDYVTSVKAIPTEGKNGVDELNAAILAAEQALAAQDSDFSAINTAISNLVAAVKAFNEANKPEPAEGIIYSWESPAGEVIEAGGTIAYVNGDGDRLNYKNGDYYTICLNGKKANLNDETASANAGHMVITLNKALEEGDVIAMTAYINKNESKKASAYIVFENGTSMEGEVYSDEANIDPAFGGVPTTKTMEVPAAAAGSKTVTLTRSQAGTNLFITKLEISEKSDLPTGIKNLTPALSKGEGVYNLNGQKVNKAQKGMYIINGHKVVIK